MHPLEAILQLQIGSDQAAVSNLPYVTSTLTSACFQPSPHLQKWIARVNSLIHAKHPGARWAGLCLALNTSILSKDIMMESAQGWIAYSLPALSKEETPPFLKACIRLAEYIFVSAIEFPEFQRQVAMPNVPKFCSALATIAEKAQDKRIRHAAYASLTTIIPIYPSLNRQLHPTLLSLTLNTLSGSVVPTNDELINDACELHAVLHFTGGKVGAAHLWRKSLDTALTNAWSALTALRTTSASPLKSNLTSQPSFGSPPADPVLSVPLSLDRLKCSITLLEHLLRATTLRPVPVCIGELNKLSQTLIGCTTQDLSNAAIDPSRHALEESATPLIWKLGCSLIIQMAKTLRYHLNPHLKGTISHILYHLENSLPKKNHIEFLRCLSHLLRNTYELHDPISVARLTKSLLPHLTVFLTHQSEVSQQAEGVSGSKRRKKRARGYEGDEVFKVGPSVLCPTPEDREIILMTLDNLYILIKNPQLLPSIQSLARRLIVSLLLELPQYTPSVLSPDPAFHGLLYAKLLEISSQRIMSTSSGWMDSAVGLVIKAVADSPQNNPVLVHAVKEASREIDTLLHPRLPPLIRRHPPIEAISLLRSENVTEDDEIMRDVMKATTTEEREVPSTEATTTQKEKSSEHRMSMEEVMSAGTKQPLSINDVPSVSSSHVTEQPQSLKVVETTPTTSHQAASIPHGSTIPVASIVGDIPSVAPRAGETNATRWPSTSVGLRNARQDDEDDEEIPDIDMASDSDSEQ